jgi:UDP-N-acetylglucosamine 4,6-dehydratase
MGTEFYEGSKILITGATGTMGRALVADLLRRNPSVIRVFSRDEAKQFDLQQEYSDDIRLRFLIGDVREKDRVRRAMEGIDYVFHCAALKQVPSSEYNPFEAVKTNVIGTQNVLEAAIETGVKRVVCTSSDKAICPTNTMGATKLLAEKLVAAANYSKGPHEVVFTGVRFGNVIGSRGSVIPVFVRQILAEQRVTVTRPDMTRFMMSVSEAVSLTERALEIAQGGEIFVLKMPVIRISDLAKAVVDRVCSLVDTPASKVKVEEIGLRPGEKMYEELMTREEARHALAFPDMFVVPPEFCDREPEYPGAIKANEESYSSCDIDPLSLAEVLELLDRSRVIEQCMRGYGCL